MRFVVGVLLLLGYSAVYAQSMQKMEEELLVAFKRIQPGADSLQAANDRFTTLLLDYAANYPATMRTDFNDLVKEGLVIAASVDGLFRIYSWDTRLGGTAHDYRAIYQYKNDNKLYALQVPKREGDLGQYYSGLYMLKHEEKTWYLALSLSRYSGKNMYQCIRIFSIDGAALKKEKLIQTSSGLQSELGFSFDMATVGSKAERNMRLIYFDEVEQQLHLPVVLEDGRVTSRFTVYEFNGEYFEKLRD